jgi:hypothetical protein
MTKRALPPDGDRFPMRNAGTSDATPGTRVYATRDHEAIQAWAERHDAEPATGEATSSGPSTVSVNDGGAGIRFNFPAAGRFRPISWDEWFENFEAHGLTFVYEEEPETADGPSAGAPNLPHVRQKSAPSARIARYRLLKEEDLDPDVDTGDVQRR